MSRRGKRVGLLVALALAVLLPLSARWWRGQRDHCCELDGMRLVPAYRVRVLQGQDRNHEFCSIRCAEIWLQGKDLSATEVFVTDETSGQEIVAAAAYFVRSLVWTTRVSGNRVHAFRERIDAEAHAQRCRGTLLDDAHRPFAVR